MSLQNRYLYQHVCNTTDTHLFDKMSLQRVADYVCKFADEPITQLTPTKQFATECNALIKKFCDYGLTSVGKISKNKDVVSVISQLLPVMRAFHHILRGYKSINLTHSDKPYVNYIGGDFYNMSIRTSASRIPYDANRVNTDMINAVLGFKYMFHTVPDGLTTNNVVIMPIYGTIVCYKYVISSNTCADIIKYYDNFVNKG